MGFRRPVYMVMIDGVDVTSRFAPRVKKITVTKASKRASHTAEILLADPEGTTLLPGDGAELIILAGVEGEGVGNIFEGTVNDVNSRGSKGGGRELTISATSADQKGKIKQPALRHKDGGTFKDTATAWGQKAGLQVFVNGSMASIERTYWYQQNESFQAWGQRMAEELGGTFQIVGKRAVFSPRNEGISATGKTLTPIYATFGENMESWAISPIIGRPQYEKVQVRYYDRKEAKWKDEKVDVKEANAKVSMTDIIPAATKANAGGKAKSGSKKSEREKGSGTVMLLGDYAIEPEAQCFVSGARDGIDGEYIVDAVTHTIDKKSGFQSSVTIKKPAGTAGKDSRASKSSGSTTQGSPAADGT